VSSVESNKRQLCINGFFSMVIFFTSLAIAATTSTPSTGDGTGFRHSEFLQLFETISTAMCVRNKILNYNKMLNAIQVWNRDRSSVEAEIRAYVMLLKVNYLFGKHSDQLREIASRF
jgi:hypothetical protein